MRTLHEERHARPMHDPLGLTAQSREIERGGSPEEIPANDREISSVNPLWMITAGLAAFIVLLVVVW